MASVTLPWNQIASYRIVGLRHFTNPLDGSSVERTAPPSIAVSVAAMPPLALAVAGGTPYEGGVRFPAPRGEFLSLQGSYTPAELEGLSLIASGPAGQVSATAQGGGFNLQLPASGELWTLQISDPQQLGRQAALTILVEADSSAPTVTINGAAEIDTIAASIALNGSVADSQTDIVSIVARSDRTPGIEYPVVRNGDAFFVEYPLQQGVNQLTIIATDRAGNIGSATVRVTRRPPQPLTVQAQLVGHAVHVSWTAAEDSIPPAGFHIERAQHPSEQYQRLNAVLLTGNSWVDEGVENGQGYRYRVVSVYDSGHGSDPSAPANVLAAWHDVAVSGLVAQRSSAGANLSWDAGGSEIFLVERALDGGEFTALQEVQTPQATDALAWNQVASYRIVGQRRFTDPFTGNPVTLSAPPSAPAGVDALPPLTLAVSGGTPYEGGVGFPAPRGEFLTLQGSYTPAQLAGLSVTASGPAGQVTTPAQGGSFSLLLPASGELWTLQISDPQHPSRHASLTITVEADRDSPVVTLNAEPEFDTTDTSLGLSGSVTDSQTDIVSIVARSDRTPGVDYTVIRNGDAIFVELPLEQGANRLTVIATDRAGNTGSANVLVNRRPPRPTTISAELAGHAVQLSWTAAEDSAPPAGFHVERALHSSEQYQRLNTELVTSNSWTDEGIENGQAYRYRVVAVYGSGHGSEPSSPAAIFVAWHDTAVTGLTAQRIAQGRVALAWSAEGATAFRIERAIDSAEPLPLQTVESASATDTLDWKQSASYRVVGLRRFTNPLDGSSVERAAPASEAVAVAALPQMTIAIDGGIPYEGGVRFPAPYGDLLVLQGRYTPAALAAEASASGPAGTVTAQGQDGAFTLLLSAEGDLWSVSVVDPEFADRRASITVLVERDSAAPQVTITPPVTPTTLASVGINGAVADSQSEVRSIVAHSDRHPGQEFTVARNGDAFFVEVPLALGDNLISISATDRAGNTGTASVTVTRRPPAPTALVAQLVGHAVQLNWAPGDAPTPPSGFHIERALHPAETYERITEQAVTGNTWSDSTVINGNGYRYRVIAVNGAVASEPSAPAAIFAVWNDQAVSGLQAQRTPPAGVALTWDGSGSDSFRVERAGEDGNYGSVAQTTASSASDSLAWNHAASYRVIGLRRFTDPFDGSTVERAAPPSAAVTVAALPPLVLNVEGGTPSPEGLVFPPAVGEFLAVGGKYTPVGLAARIRANGPAGQVNTIGQSGEFSLNLPAAGQGWTIVAQDPAYPDRSASVVIVVQRDTTAPVVTIDQPSQSETAEEVARISGTARDAQSDLARLVARSNRYPGVDFAVEQGDSGRYTAELALQPGDNLITVIATDRSGNTGSASVTIKRNASAKPTVRILSPADGTRIEDTKVDVVVEVSSSAGPDQLRVVFRNQAHFPEQASADGRYSFSFPNAQLSPGVNTLTASAMTPGGNGQASVHVVQGKKDEDPKGLPPQIRLHYPGANRTMTTPNVNLSGEVEVSVPPAAMTLDGAPVTLTRRGATLYGFSAGVTLSGEHSFTLRATDGDGQAATQNVRLSFDDAAPQLMLDELQPAPAINTVRERPYRLTGTATDAHLSGVSVNGDGLLLRPLGENRYAFEWNASLPTGQDLNVLAIAWDTAGRETRQNYILRADATAVMEVLQPLEGAEVAVPQLPGTINVMVRALAEEVAEIKAGIGNTDTSLGRDGVVFGGALPLAGIAQDGTALIQFKAYNEAGAQIGHATVRVRVQTLQDVPLAVQETVPANGQADTLPNIPVTLRLNKPIDPAKLSVTVRETVHGMSYDTRTPVPSELVVLNMDPVRVDRDLVTVAGNVAPMPGNVLFAYYPQRDFAYGARLLVEVRYDGAELHRFEFFVRELPTFAQGIIGEPGGNGLQGIRVSLPELGLTTVTGSGGIFSFGSGELDERRIRGGRYLLRINEGFTDPRFGEGLRRVVVEDGVVNRLGVIRLLPLSDDVPFTRMSGGAGQVRSAKGEVEWNFNGARLVFPDGRLGGEAQTQFLPRELGSFPASPLGITSWLYATQPPGIAVEGTVAVRFHLPAEFGSYSGVPPNGTRGLIVGWDPQSDAIVPIGVGRVEDGEYIRSERMELKSLDALGVSFNRFDPEYLQWLADYGEGRISLAQLIQKIRSDKGAQ